MIRHITKWAIAFAAATVAIGLIGAATTAPPKLTPPAKKTAEVGKTAPAFTLIDIDGKSHSLADYKGKVVVLEWFNAGCPWSGKNSPRSVHGTGRIKQLVASAKQTQSDVVYLLIDSSADRKKETVIAQDKAARTTHGIKQPILIDYDGKVGKSYGAKTTPHMYVIGADGVLQYSGALGARQVKDGEPDASFVLNAIKKMKSGEAVEPARTRPWGCGVKYN